MACPYPPPFVLARGGPHGDRSSPNAAEEQRWPTSIWPLGARCGGGGSSMAPAAAGTRHPAAAGKASGGGACPHDGIPCGYLHRLFLSVRAHHSEICPYSCSSASTSRASGERRRTASRASSAPAPAPPPSPPPRRAPPLSGSVRSQIRASSTGRVPGELREESASAASAGLHAATTPGSAGHRISTRLHAAAELLEERRKACVGTVVE
ncbi:unnamed protein product [Urochloa humidicola]